MYYPNGLPSQQATPPVPLKRQPFSPIPVYLRPEYYAARAKSVGHELAVTAVLIKHGLLPGTELWTLADLARLEFLRWRMERVEP